MNTTILSIQNLSKTYVGKQTTVHALQNISLDIRKGEVFSLLGVNGAGKTTLSSILATLHPPTSGSVMFNGESIYTDINAYRLALGFCPQKPNLDSELTVEENLFFAGRYFLMNREDITYRIASLMQDLKLEKYAKFEINSLSGGNKQKVLIARALIHSPAIVILDEPTVGLDPDVRRKLWDLIRSLKNMGITVILTTHYLDEAEYLSDRICILHKGKIRLIESVKTLKEQHSMSNLEEIFIKLTQEYEMSEL